MTNSTNRVEIITSVQCRRRWTAPEKVRMVEDLRAGYDGKLGGSSAGRCPKPVVHLALQQPHLGRVATRRPSNPNLGLGDHNAIFSSAPSLPRDVPRTPGMRQMASQPLCPRDIRPPKPWV